MHRPPLSDSEFQMLRRLTVTLNSTVCCNWMQTTVARSFDVQWRYSKFYFQHQSHFGLRSASLTFADTHVLNVWDRLQALITAYFCRNLSFCWINRTTGIWIKWSVFQRYAKGDSSVWTSHQLSRRCSSSQGRQLMKSLHNTNCSVKQFVHHFKIFVDGDSWIFPRWKYPV